MHCGQTSQIFFKVSQLSEQMDHSVIYMFHSMQQFLWQVDFRIDCHEHWLQSTTTRSWAAPSSWPRRWSSSSPTPPSSSSPSSSPSAGCSTWPSSSPASGDPSKSLVSSPPKIKGICSWESRSCYDTGSNFCKNARGKVLIAKTPLWCRACKMHRLNG